MAGLAAGSRCRARSRRLTASAFVTPLTKEYGCGPGRPGYEAPFDSEPRRDLDMASYGVAKVLDGQKGTRYPDMAWEPKQVFDALASRFGPPKN